MAAVGGLGGSLLSPVVLGRFVCLEVGRIGKRVAFVEPPAQVDRATSVAAERHRGRRFRLKFVLANRAVHGRYLLKRETRRTTNRTNYTNNRGIQADTDWLLSYLPLFVLFVLFVVPFFSI